MFFCLFLSFSFEFQLKGMWNVTFEGYKVPSAQNFRLRFSLQNTTYVGAIRKTEKHQMIPKRIHVKELIPDERYMLILPFSENPRFAEFWFKNETGILKSSVNSTSNQWNVTATIIPSEKMEILLEKYGKHIWYKYTATPFTKSSSIFGINGGIFLILILFVAVVFISFIIKFICCNSSEKTKEKKE